MTDGDSSRDFDRSRGARRPTADDGAYPGRHLSGAAVARDEAKAPPEDVGLMARDVTWAQPTAERQNEIGDRGHLDVGPPELAFGDPNLDVAAEATWGGR